MNKVTNVQATVPLPSADLITYRFDNIDTQLKHFETKIDTITNAFLPREEAVTMRKDISTLNDKVTELHDTNIRQQGAIEANRRYFNIALTVLGIIVGGVTTYLGIHQ